MEGIQSIRKNVKESCQAQVESFLIGRIESKTWKIGEKIPSERDLSEELGVSRTTVRNAVLSLTSRGFFNRFIGQGTFVRKQVLLREEMRSLNGTLGYIVCREKSIRKPLSLEAFYFEVFSGIEEETAKREYHTLFSYFDDFNIDEREILTGFLKKVDGVIIEEAWNPEFLESIRESGVPAVLFAPSAIHDGFDQITVDLKAGVRKAVRYLIGLGHRKIAIINGPSRYESARIRFEAWKETLGEAGLPIDTALIEGDEAWWTAEAGYNAMCRLLDRKVSFTAVFCVNDLLAVGALSSLYERSIRVPDDVSVIGFDDSELSRHASPPLTTMRIHAREMAHMAVERIFSRIDNENLPAVRIEFPIDLLARKSCGAVREKVRV